ncbi:MAG: tetratricopeptide repeat protein [Acidobacteriota bacterium]|nr:tetratricopeptide repeat protein [Acidobacteriota bacterium]
MAHHDDESLFEYVEGTSPAAEEIHSHVAECDTCSSEVGEQRELIAQLETAEVWQETAAPAPRQFMLNVAAFAERARLEDEQAVVICDQVLTGPANWWAQRMRNTGGAHTAGVVKQLLERWRTMIEHAPTNALQVTAMAIQVANALDVAQYPCDYVVKLRAQAARDHAFVLSFLGRHPEALDFIERAKRLFEQVPMPEYDLARVAVVKSAILRLIDRNDEAVALVREAAETFLRFGDRSRYLNARITEGAVLFDRGSTEEALAVWSAINGDPDLEETSKVRVAHNIATCYAALGQPERAAASVRDCVAQYELLGMETERTRSRWLLGHALAASGRASEAIPILRESWREFEQLDMISDAGLVALELAEALLIVGEADEVPAICRDVIAQFTRAGMASRAITALSFLREAVAIGQANASLIRHVHAFLRELPNEQPRLFAPPPGGFGE